MNTLRLNLFYGLVALVPFAMIAFVAYVLFRFWTLTLLPASDALGLTTNESRALAVVLAVVGVFVICFVVGALMRTRLGTAFFGFLEARVLSLLPGYTLVANLLRGFGERRSNYPAAFVRLTADGPQSPAFVMEDDGGPKLTVFVPLAPVMTMGQIYRVERDRVEIVPNATIEMFNAVAQWGDGIGALGNRNAVGDHRPGSR